MIGAWLLALAMGIACVLRENDWARSRPAAATHALFGALQMVVVLLRYADDVDWGARGWIYLLFLLSVLAVGAYALWASFRASPGEPVPAAA